LVELVRKRIDQWSVEEVAHLIRSLHFTVLFLDTLLCIAGSFVNHKINGINVESLFARLSAGEVPTTPWRKKDQHRILRGYFHFGQEKAAVAGIYQVSGQLAGRVSLFSTLSGSSQGQAQRASSSPPPVAQVHFITWG
jgi:hypothetical protein